MPHAKVTGNACTKVRSRRIATLFGGGGSSADTDATIADGNAPTGPLNANHGSAVRPAAIRDSHADADQTAGDADSSHGEKESLRCGHID